MVKCLVLIEGGGSTRAEQATLRKGFRALFDALLIGKPKPKVLCAGGRREAFKDFKHARETDPTAVCLLLVDSEGPVGSGVSPWDHVASRVGDGWLRPANATDEQLHFMAESMEAWLVADAEALASYYGSEFKTDKLPRRRNLEQVPKADLARALDAATKDARPKGKYRKSHGFELVGKIDPTKVRRACPEFAERFFNALERQ